MDMATLGNTGLQVSRLGAGLESLIGAFPAASADRGNREHGDDHYGQQGK